LEDAVREFGGAEEMKKSANTPLESLIWAASFRRFAAAVGLRMFDLNAACYL
jgi:hypothetical protein